MTSVSNGVDNNIKIKQLLLRVQLMLSIMACVTQLQASINQAAVPELRAWAAL